MSAISFSVLSDRRHTESLLIIISKFIYSWYCHIDDDMYINTLELENYLLSRDHNEAHYIGRIGNDRYRVKKAALDYYSKKLVS